MGVVSIMLLILGIISIIYYIRIVKYVNVYLGFQLVWLLLGNGFIVLSAALKMDLFKSLFVNKRVNIVIFCIFFILILLFISIEGIIIYNANAVPMKETDYVVVLGARVDGGCITPTLRSRLNAALEYVKEHEQVKVVVSGGRGETEDVTEAYMMSNYLIENGIDADRVIKEDRSRNTYENMKFTKEIIGTDANIVIVSNGFHMYRATMLAKKQGFNYIQGLGTATDRLLIVTQYSREAFGFVKDFIIGNI